MSRSSLRARNSGSACQIVGHCFLDPDATVDVIAQKLRQAGFAVSTRSVVRVIEEHGLQKETRSLPTQS
jgi:hypothetical protein